MKLTGAPITQVRPGQCVIVTDLLLLAVRQNLWMDNLYIRHHTTDRTDSTSAVWSGSKDCNLWMTSITIQGDGVGDPHLGALALVGGQLYAEGMKDQHADVRSEMVDSAWNASA